MLRSLKNNYFVIFGVGVSLAFIFFLVINIALTYAGGGGGGTPPPPVRYVPRPPPSSIRVNTSGKLFWNAVYQGYKDTTFFYRTTNNAVRNPNFSVQYGARVLDSSGAVFSCGSTVQAGSNLKFVFDGNKRTDISWFVTGGAFDSPYGSWCPGLAVPSKARICS